MQLEKSKKPYIIAEIGINHEGNYLIAKKLIYEAKKAGADAVKFQVFKPGTLAIKKIKKNNLQKKNSGKEDLSNIWKRVCLNFLSLKKLRDTAKKLKIGFICTPFDFESLKIVKKLKLDAIKIASSDVTDLPLISQVAKLKKPVILSTGMSTSEEISKALKLLKRNKVSLLHCVSLYPCEYKDANLKRILALKKKFKKFKIGYSDHCRNFEASILAINYGAKIIEKHFTLNKKKIGLDHSLSADPKDLRIICEYAKNVNFLPGANKINPSAKERKFTKHFRKGVYINKRVLRNQKIKKENIIIRRPQNNIKPDMYYKLIGKIAKKQLNIYESVNLKKIY